ncbi:MAG: cyclic 2,3-diphosphoglycerate synthase [bacterium]|nr:cyclic 2,3-diphosphoglycerate synthase [bacterium]
MVKKVLIMGAAGRDFHNFNVYFRDKKEFEVVAFTATQIPDIAGRKYPKELAGKLYPKGIPIYAETDLVKIIKDKGIKEVYFSYSDVKHEYVMHKASQVQAAGADFILLGPASTMIKSKKPVISICAVRTGCGKSQTTRRVLEILKEKGKKCAVIRHPMPYGDLNAQTVQRFEKLSDLDKHKCTIEEREEYEPHIVSGTVVYAGVDYGKILAAAEKESDFIVWDGGNNDFSFYSPDLQIVVVDPHRAGHELLYYPGETNFNMADVMVVNKIDTADKKKIKALLDNIKQFNPKAQVVMGKSPVTVTDPKLIKGKTVLVIEDGPTLTHGEMKYGAGYVAAKNCKVKKMIDPRPYAVGSIVETYKKYSHLSDILPAMGYGNKQMNELQETINKAKVDVVVVATPIDLGKLIKINKPSVRVMYKLEESGKPTLKEIITKRFKNKF